MKTKKQKKKSHLYKISDGKTDEDKAIYAVVRYLDKRGWSCLVGGFSAIEQGSAKYNFRLIFSFTGKKKDANT